MAALGSKESRINPMAKAGLEKMVSELQRYSAPWPLGNCHARVFAGPPAQKKEVPTKLRFRGHWCYSFTTTRAPLCLHWPTPPGPWLKHPPSHRGVSLLLARQSVHPASPIHSDGALPVNLPHSVEGSIFLQEEEAMSLHSSLPSFPTTPDLSGRATLSAYRRTYFLDSVKGRVCGIQDILSTRALVAMAPKRLG